MCTTLAAVVTLDLYCHQERKKWTCTNFHHPFVYSLGTAEFLPSFMVFYWFFVQSGRLQVFRVNIL